MSVQAIAWVLDHSPTTGTDRLVMIALANHAGKNPSDGAWEAWPGIATIAREAGIGRERTVQDSLARLEAAGDVMRLVNGAPDSRMRADRRPNLYRLPLHRGVTPSDTPTNPPRGDASRPDGVTLDDATGCREASPKPNTNLKNEPPPLPPATPETDGAPGPAVVEELIAQAVEILAQRDLVAALPRPHNPAAWLEAVRRRLRSTYGPSALTIVRREPGITAQALANRLDSGPPDPLESTQRAARAREDRNEAKRLSQEELDGLEARLSPDDFEAARRALFAKLHDLELDAALTPPEDPPA